MPNNVIIDNRNSIKLSSNPFARIYLRNIINSGKYIWKFKLIYYRPGDSDQALNIGLWNINKNDKTSIKKDNYTMIGKIYMDIMYWTGLYG